MKSVTKFSGGGGVDLGMIAAGWEHIYGIEYDGRIAQVARDNGLNTITADILKIKPEDYPGMDWMHDSPPCPNFSTAKAGGEETENDIALAQAVCDWIAYQRPRFYTLENVYGYRLSKSWAMIADTLHRHGYLFNYWHVNMANYGVPQTRKRMIVIARRDGIMPQLPPQTHSENPQVGLFETKKRWVSWYEAIEDLIPTLPDSEFAPWQLERLPDEYMESLMIKDGDNYAPVVNGRIPSFTQSATNGARAFISDGQINNGEMYTYAVDDSMRTVKASDGEKGRMPRAFIMNAANPNGNEKRKYHNEEEAAKTITSGDSLAIKAFVADGQANSDGTTITTRKGVEPIYTVTSGTSIKKTANAAIGGRVVKMTTRALARFQTFPDTYALPETNTLAARIIGNAVPPLFMQQVGEMFEDA